MSIKTISTQFGAGAVALALVSVGVLQASDAAFSSSFNDAQGSFDSGKVVIAEGANGVNFASTSNMVPGNTDVACVEVDFTGDVASSVKLYATVSGAGVTTDLTDYLTLDLDEVADPAGATAAACNGATKVADLSDGTLSVFSATNWATGLDTLDGGAAWDPSATATKWFRIKLTLQDTNDAQDKTGNATFTWEAQNN